MRPNPPRPLARELALGERIAAERTARGWSYESLAQRMTEAGVPIQPSAIYKTEKGDPPRRVVFEEAIALAHVFGVSLDDLATPAEVLTSRRLKAAYKRWESAYDEAERASSALRREVATLLAEVENRPELTEQLVLHLVGGRQQWLDSFRERYPGTGDLDLLETLLVRPDYPARDQQEEWEPTNG